MSLGAVPGSSRASPGPEPIAGPLPGPKRVEVQGAFRLISGLAAWESSGRRRGEGKWSAPLGKDRLRNCSLGSRALGWDWSALVQKYKYL